jgi:hypothetical protein
VIASSKTKLNRAAPAIDLYTGPLCRTSVEVAKSEGLPILVLSTRYGLLDPTEIIEPYELSYEAMTPSEREKLSRSATRFTRSAPRAWAMTRERRSSTLKSKLESEEPLRHGRLVIRDERLPESDVDHARAHRARVRPCSAARFVTQAFAVAA